MAGMLGFALGVILVQGLPALPPGWVQWALALGALSLFVPRWRPVGGLCAGLLWATVAAQAALAHRLPAALEGIDLIVEGRIVDLPERDERRVRFLFEPARIEHPDLGRLPRRLRLSWYGDAPELRAGERWRLTVRLKRPRGLMNPGGFDYERWLFQHRIDAVGYVRSPQTAQRLATTPSLDRLRQDLADALHRRLEGRPAAGVLVALVVGDERGIAKEQWEALRRTGTTHLISISGLHISLLALAAYRLTATAWRRSARLCTRAPAPLAATAVAIVAATGYAALAGFSLPTQRALIMLAVPALALLARRRIDPWRGFVVALVAVLLWDPFAPLSPGFWLSFGAVAILLAAGLYRSPEPGWRQLVTTQLCLSLALLPLTLLWFQQASWISPLANVVAIPWGMAIVPLALLAAALLPVPLLGDGLLWLSVRLTDGLLWLLMLMGAWKGGASELAAPSSWLLLLAGLGVLLLLAPHGWPGRWLAAPLLAAAVWRDPGEGPPPGAVDVTLLDVGQGTAVVVRTAGHALLYDAGPGESMGLDAGETVVLPFLRSQGIARLDALVISHADGDHSGGARAVLAAMPVAALYAGEELADFPRALPCRAGHAWQWDGVELEFLWPDPASGARGNDASCVLKLSAGGHSLLLAGDIGARAEAALLQRQAAKLRADVLLVPHHGSQTSSTAPFLAAVAPRTAVITVGYRNRYRLPRDEVLARYQEIGSELLRTDHEGAIRLRLDAGGVSAPRGERATARRYYRYPPGPG